MRSARSTHPTLSVPVRALAQLEVFDTILGFVSVDVMNRLLSLQHTSKMARHYDPMF